MATPALTEKFEVCAPILPALAPALRALAGTPNLVWDSLINVDLFREFDFMGEVLLEEGESLVVRGE